MDQYPKVPSGLDLTTCQLENSTKTKLMKWIISVCTYISNFDIYKVYTLNREQISQQPGLKRFYSNKLRIDRSSTYSLIKYMRITYGIYILQFSFRTFILPVISGHIPTKLSPLISNLQTWDNDRVNMTLGMGILGFSLMAHSLSIHSTKLFITTTKCPDAIQLRFLVEPSRELWRHRIFVKSKLDDFKCSIENHRRVLYTRDPIGCESYELHRNEISLMSKQLDINEEQLNSWYKWDEINLLPSYYFKLYKQFRDYIPLIAIITMSSYQLTSLVIANEIVVICKLEDSIATSKDRSLIYQTYILVSCISYEFMCIMVLYLPLVLSQEYAIIFIKRELNSCLNKMRNLYASSKVLKTGEKCITYSTIREVNKLLFVARIKLELSLSDLKRCSNSTTLLVSRPLSSVLVIALQLTIFATLSSMKTFEFRALSIISLLVYNIFAIQSAHISGNLRAIEKTCWCILAESKYLSDRHYEPVCEDFALKLWRQYIILLNQTRGEYAPHLFDIELTYGKILELDFFFFSFTSILFINRDSLIPWGIK